ncbi:MAG: hypothetical protein ACI8ZM_002042 [Crocinitomix sp.]|jgi:hypothetical protein
MKNLKLILPLFFLFTINSFAQDFEVPKNAKLDKAEDYAQYEQDVIDGVNWALETPLGEDESKRKDTYKFLITWIIGSPNVSIVLNEKIMTFSGEGNCLIIYMGAWTKYALESKDFTDELKGSLAGINAVITFYEKNKKEMGKNKHVEKYIKLKKKGKLESTVKSRMA